MENGDFGPAVFSRSQATITSVFRVFPPSSRVVSPEIPLGFPRSLRLTSCVRNDRSRPPSHWPCIAGEIVWCAYSSVSRAAGSIGVHRHQLATLRQVPSKRPISTRENAGVLTILDNLQNSIPI